MLCSKCYKKITPGEEIYKSAFSYILINDQPLNSGGVFCKKCVKEFDRRQQKYKIFAIILLILVPVFILSVFFIFLWWKVRN
ncbi:MAG: hypothetical protein MRERV_27c031 [Mycoplasmataceae bacterium RV_VA103A]|nr:MAG: hypothetical protein MRERV_27c031 [Mycoplasmataceae bacterium RV_VA103A]